MQQLAREKDSRIPAQSFGSAEQPAWEHVLFNIAFTEDDMRRIMNDWRADRDSWMRTETQTKYRACTCQKEWHGLEKHAFSTYLHELSGCKSLLRLIVELPVISKDGSAVQPAVLKKLLGHWARYMESPAYKNVMEKRSAHTSSSARGAHSVAQPVAGS